MMKAMLCISLLLTPLCQAEIVIGQSVPTTGVDAETGKALALGATLYFSRVNANGGINGEAINHQIRDDGNDAKRTIANTQELIDKQNAIALVSFYGTNNTSELIKSKTLERANIALIGVHSGADIIRNHPYIFHTRASYGQEIERIIQLLNTNLGATQIAVVAQRDAYGQAGYEALNTALAKRQLKLAGESWYEKNTANTSPSAQAMAKLNPEAIILVAISKPAASFIKKFKELGGTSQLYALSPVQFEEVNKQINSRVSHGLGISQAYPFPNNTKLALIREFQEDAASVLKGDERPSYAILEGYLAARITVEAIKRAGKNPSRSSVYNALSSLKNYDLGGFNLDFSDKKRQGSNFVELTMISPNGSLSR
ncbi:ABC transporter substrate-binding protein [Iodobacter sp.]|uniref:ABC transporter substrate-binding protein n=1 Tax=Iodobacter sp. TaxID=1915058 RepID=UPI0025EF2C0B|nr:ABC transporter substrate-binding protein [Iodobacter sp.]